MHRAILIGLVAACGGTDAERPRTFGGERPVTLQVPASAGDGRDRPLLVILHGYGLYGTAQQAYFGMAGFADSQDAFVLAPDGTIDSTKKQFWNADPACCDFENRNPDDVAYLGGMIEDVMDAWPIDPARVVLIGHSNGGFMSYRMACERADLVSAIAVLAGVSATMPATCTPARGVNVLHVHGTMDVVIPYDGDARLSGVGAVASVTQWAEHDGCATTRSPAGMLDLDTGLAGTETDVERADGCPPGAAVELWTIQDGTHVPNLGPSFAPAVWQWFSEHPRT